MFHTGICENTVSKRTIISVITGLKNLLSERIYTVTQSSVKESSFSEVVNREGCIFLKDFEVHGASLFDLYKSFTSSNFFSEDTKHFLVVLHQIIKASELISSNTGSYPSLLLNSVFIDEEGGNIVFLPHKLIEFLNKYRDVEEQLILFYPLERPSGVSPSHQHDLTLSLARILYLFFSKNQKSKDSVILDISNFMNNTPRVLCDAIWKILYGKKFGLETFNKLIYSMIRKEKGNVREKIPLARKRKVALFKYSLKQFFIKKRTLLIIIVVLVTVLSYLFMDYFSHRKKIDYTIGLEPRQVVELYFQAVDTLDMDMLDSVFYKRTGREIKDEVSRIYVMSRLEQTVGTRIVKPEELEEEDLRNLSSQDQKIKIYGIEDVEIQELSSGVNPIFHTKYKKYISAGEELSIYSLEETIYLKEYNDHWYIIRIERKIAD